VCIPVIGNIIYALGGGPVKGFDYTAFCIFIGAMIYTIVIFNSKFMNVLPVAKDILIDSIPEGILILNDQNQIVAVNSIAKVFLGRDNSGLIGKSFADIQSAPELRFTHSGKEDQISVLGTNQQVLVYLRLKMVDLLDKKGNLIGQMVILTDISELEKAQLKLESLYRQERELRNSLELEIQKRSQYTRAVVHELRTPLTSIIASGELLESQVKETIQKSLVNNIQRSADNMEKRVNELFELARGEMGMLDIQPEPMDINLLISEIISEISPIAQGHHLELRADLSPGKLMVFGDRNRLHQVLTNVVSNSLKFTTQGSIVISSSRTSNLALIQVKDTGKGISPDEMETLFNPYQRNLKENWKSSGLGIGLTLCKIYVELHHGTIQAESLVGKGSTISFSVPLTE